MFSYKLIPILHHLSVRGVGPLFLTAVEVIDDRLALRFRGADQRSLIQRTRPFPTVVSAPGSVMLEWIAGRSGGSGFDDTWDVLYRLPTAARSIVIEPGSVDLEVDLNTSDWRQI